MKISKYITIVLLVVFVYSRVEARVNETIDFDNYVPKINPSKKLETTIEETTKTTLLFTLPFVQHYEYFDTVAIHHKIDKKIECLPESLELQLLPYGNLTDYAHPLRHSIVTSDYGFRRRRNHYGIDLDLEKGDSVYNVFRGVVRIAKYNHSYGNLVIVRHDNGLETYYAHLSALMVKPGDTLQAGALIGLGGNTGRSYGAHLHFEIRYKGFPIDPKKIIDFENAELICENFVLNPKKDLTNYDENLAEDELQIKKRYKQKKIYIVRKGDTLDKVAKRYKTSPKRLKALNRLRTNTIRPGQKIRVA